MRTTMTVVLWLILLISVYWLISWYLKVQRLQKLKRLPPKRRILINQRLVKLIYNPFDEKWMWTKFNPENRTWEWVRTATEVEVTVYKGLVLNEDIGDKILILGENENHG